MRTATILIAASTIVLIGCAQTTASKDGRLTLRNDSHEEIVEAQINFVHDYAGGQLLSAPRDPFDQITKLPPLSPGATMVVPYASLSDGNIDILVRWRSGRTARFNVGYVSEGLNPEHVVIATETGLLFDGKPPAPIQSDPESHYVAVPSSSR